MISNDVINSCFSKQWKIRDLDKYDSLKLQNRLELGMKDYFVDSDLEDFDSSRIQVELIASKYYAKWK